MEDDDASVRVVANERGIPPSVRGCFDKGTLIVVAAGSIIAVRLWCHKDGIECEEWTGGYYFLA